MTTLDGVVKDGPVDRIKDLEKNRVENLKEKIQRKDVDKEKNVQRKKEDDAVNQI